jgi:endonuclease/exonuclease/phosphatase (EEP) superfamily protein YafD
LRVFPRDVHRIQIALEGGRDAALATAPLLAAVALVRRRPVTALIATALTVRSRADRRHRRAAPPSLEGPSLRVVSANLLGGNPRVADLGRELVADAADVVVVQELTPQHADGLRAAGLLDAMPHHVLDPQPGYHGSGLYARWPITDAEVFDVYGMGMAAATVHGPVGAVQVVAVHVINPARDAMMPVWQAQLDWLAEHIRRSDLPVVLAGDYNATMDHRGLRVLSAAGLTDAHDAAGRGLGLTWPRRSYRGAGRWPALPVMRLDHVFVPPALGVRAVRTATSAGSDHRRVIADLARVIRN